MPSSSAAAFALASHLRARGDEDLAHLIRRREVREAGINDFFDLAERLLDKASVQAALTKLDRRALLTLAVICELGATGNVVPLDDVAQRIREIDHPRAIAFPTTLEGRAARIADIGLIAIEEGGYIAFDAVCEQLAAWPSMKLPSTAELTAPLPEWLGETGQINQDATNALAAERAFSTSMAVIELLAELERDGVKELVRGGYGGPDLKRIAAATGVPIEQAPLLMRIARKANLLSAPQGRWQPAADAEAWSLEPLAARWTRLADAWLASLHEDTRFILSDRAYSVWGAHFEEFIDWLYPAADAAFRGLVDTQLDTGELLGIIADSAPSTAGSALLKRGPKAAEAAMVELLPPEVANVYLQHDLSIVSPGPLEPRIDARLRALTDVESRALASTFRISRASITRALAAGDTAESILDFLRGISLSGIPQPVRYLVSETAGRYAMLKVGRYEKPDAQHMSFIETDDHELLETLLVDRRLAPLGLRRLTDRRATSRFDRDVVYLAILDAAYPAAAVDSTGTIVNVERRSLPRDGAANTNTKNRDAAGSIIEKLRLSSTATAVENDSAWLERQLELAIKSKLSVTLSVTMPDGSLQDYLLEPTGLSGGRLRARDRKADIERTLPLSRIAMIGGEGARPAPRT